ncbi:MAG: hypothetical protein ACLTJ5_11345 [Clostridium sp.]
MSGMGYSRRFENDKYVSTIITNEFGVIVEMDCQLKNLPNAKREGEFFVKGNTAYRFAGKLYWRNRKLRCRQKVQPDLLRMRLMQESMDIR